MPRLPNATDVYEDLVREFLSKKRTYLIGKVQKGNLPYSSKLDIKVKNLPQNLNEGPYNDKDLEDFAQWIKQNHLKQSDEIDDVLNSIIDTEGNPLSEDKMIEDAINSSIDHEDASKSVSMEIENNKWEGEGDDELDNIIKDIVNKTSLEDQPTKEPEEEEDDDQTDYETDALPKVNEPDIDRWLEEELGVDLKNATTQPETEAETEPDTEGVPAIQLSNNNCHMDAFLNIIFYNWALLDKTLESSSVSNYWTKSTNGKIRVWTADSIREEHLKYSYLDKETEVKILHDSGDQEGAEIIRAHNVLNARVELKKMIDGVRTGTSFVSANNVAQLRQITSRFTKPNDPIITDPQHEMQEPDESILELLVAVDYIPKIQIHDPDIKTRTTKITAREPTEAFIYEASAEYLALDKPKTFPLKLEVNPTKLQVSEAEKEHLVKLASNLRSMFPGIEFGSLFVIMYPNAENFKNYEFVRGEFTVKLKGIIIFKGSHYTSLLRDKENEAQWIWVNQTQSVTNVTLKSKPNENILMVNGFDYKPVVYLYAILKNE